jgi:hypothetical protein
MAQCAIAHWDLVELTGVIAADVSKIPARALDVWRTPLGARLCLLRRRVPPRSGD